MEAVWIRIERWLAANAPAIAADFNPPATAEDIAATERFLGVTLPDDVKATYLRHNGGPAGLFEGWEWVPLEGVRDEWKAWKGLLDGGHFDDFTRNTDGQVVSSDWWNCGWIPFTKSGSGDNHCWDLAPGPHGQVGQVIQMFHDETIRPVLANSFREWLNRFADALEADEYVFTEEYGGLVRWDDL
jgi:cell wall assembly regulator SMI1